MFKVVSSDLPGIIFHHCVEDNDTGPHRWLGLAGFKDKDDANAYCDWRNSYPPKFKVGDRVYAAGEANGFATATGIITSVSERYSVRWGHPNRGTTAEGHDYRAEHLELFPHPPTKPKWEVSPGIGTTWGVVRGTTEYAGWVHSEALAKQVADMLNAQEENR